MRRLLAALSAALLLALTACTPRSQTPERHELTYLDVFDTVTTLVAYGGTGEDFSGEAVRIHAELLYYHRLYDIYNDYPGLNNLKTVNDRAGEAPVEVDRRIIDLLLEAREMYGVTGGIGFLVVIVLFASIRERMEFSEWPKAFEGFPIALVAAGLIALSFMGFSGLKVFG